MKLGWRPAVSECWLYPEAHEALKLYWQLLTAGRGRLRERAADGPAPARAYRVCKQIYTQTLGYLRGSWDDNSLFCPDWYDAVIGEAIKREYYHLHRIAEQGALPLAVYRDAVYYASADPDPTAGAPAGLRLSDKLGEFKPIGTAPIASVLDPLDSDEPNVTVFVRAFTEATR